MLLRKPTYSELEQMSGERYNEIQSLKRELRDKEQENISLKRTIEMIGDRKKLGRTVAKARAYDLYKDEYLEAIATQAEYERMKRENEYLRKEAADAEWDKTQWGY